ncbi:MAG: tRNA lysidine(34) synthetase TilS [Actinomycetota bacterium]|nr:tRNA lysidine(34) synthetase TilS [Actinomycetota bacterium]
MNALRAELKSSKFAVELLARCNFPRPGEQINCAVSGGQDSMAMLLLAVLNDCEVTAFHVDHSLRPGSDKEANMVAKIVEQLGAEFVSKTIAVEPGSNLEARARDARYAVLPEDIATGHTADDQAETLLINLLRGAGLQGLAGMQKSFNHPILNLRRSETERLCQDLAIECVNDPSNLDLKFLRNQVRHQLMPLMNDISQRDVAPILARQAELFRDDAQVLDELAKKIDPTDAKAVAGAPLAVARRAIRSWLTDVYPPDAATVERVLDVARGKTTACEIGMNREVRRSQQRLQINSKQ